MANVGWQGGRFGKVDITIVNNEANSITTQSKLMTPGMAGGVQYSPLKPVTLAGVI
jgi:hypothetical protein